MLYWALVFFIVAIIAAIFGFGNIAAGAATIAITNPRTCAATSAACPASHKRAGPSVNRTTSLLHSDTTSAVRTSSGPLP